MSSLKSLAQTVVIIAAAMQLASPTAFSQPDQKPKGTASISGQVSVDGKPSAGIAIAAFTSDSAVRTRAPVAQSISDAEGRYRLTSLGAGQYQIATMAPNLPSKESAEPNFSFLFGPSKSIVLAAGEQVDDVDLRLSRGGVITGRITDADNKPVVDERVTLQILNENGRPPVRIPYFTYMAQMTLTDDRGIYRIYGLPFGRYKLSIGLSPGDSSAGSIRGYFQRTYYPGTTDAGRAEIIDLSEGGEAANIDIRVGRREDTFKVTGRVIDESGGLVNNARISIMAAPEGRERYGPIMTGQPTADGEFRVEGVAPGRYAAYVSSEFFASDFYSDPVAFEVIDKDVSGIEIRATRGVTVSGAIAADNMELRQLLTQVPNLRVSVNVQASNNDPSQRSGGTAAVMRDGSFQVSGLRGGRATLNVYTTEGLNRPAIVSIEHAGVGISQGFEIKEGQPISDIRVLVAYGNGVIRGTVRFDGGTRPDNLRMYINCTREGSRLSAGAAQLDARGRFILRSLAPGRYEVTLQTYPTPGSAQRPRPPQKLIVTVTNEVEAEANFIVDLNQKAGEP